MSRERLSKHEMPSKVANYDAISGSYLLQGVIGQGCFATVHSAQHVETGVSVAVKIIDKQKCTNINLTRNEISALRAVSRHPYVVDVYEVTEDADFVYIVMEYCSNGNLHDYLVRNGPLSEDHARLWFSQLVCAVEYCHRAGVINGDIKNANVLIDVLGNPKLSDFGLSSLVENAYTNRVNRATGSAVFAAPEVYLAHKGIPYLGPAAEVWALGGVLHSMLTATLPFRIETYQSSWMVYKPPPKRSAPCQKLLEQMFQYVPGKRPTTSQILDSEWVLTPLSRDFTPHFPADHHAIYHNSLALYANSNSAASSPSFYGSTLHHPHHSGTQQQHHHHFSSSPSLQSQRQPWTQQQYSHPQGVSSQVPSFLNYGDPTPSQYYNGIIATPPTPRRVDHDAAGPVTMATVANTMPQPSNGGSNTRLWERLLWAHTEVVGEVDSKLEPILDIMASMGRPPLDLDTVRLLHSESHGFDTGVDAYTTFLVLVAAARHVLLDTRAQAAASAALVAAQSGTSHAMMFPLPTVAAHYQHLAQFHSNNGFGHHGNNNAAAEATRANSNYGSAAASTAATRRRHSSSGNSDFPPPTIAEGHATNGGATGHVTTVRRLSRSRPRAPTCSSQEGAAFNIFDSRGGSTAMPLAKAA